jgi:DNA uptake protein ComE-like DNA-binding protein
MKTQQLFICQLFILLLIGTLIIVQLILRHSDLLEEQVLTTENGLQLIWNGCALIANTQRHIGNEPNSTTHIPAHLTPLFFQPIPINNADFELLVTIPGVGPKLAGEIGIAKKRLGKFKKCEDLLIVNGIGTKKMNTFKKYFSFQ